MISSKEARQRSADDISGAEGFHYPLSGSSIQPESHGADQNLRKRGQSSNLETNLARVLWSVNNHRLVRVENIDAAKHGLHTYTYLQRIQRKVFVRCRAIVEMSPGGWSGGRTVGSVVNLPSRDILPLTIPYC